MVELLLVDVILTVKTIHEHNVDEDQNDEDVDGALLGEPEPQREASDLNLIKSTGEEDAAAIRDDEPNAEKDREVPQVLLPVPV